jgi:hypothetical protein
VEQGAKRLHLVDLNGAFEGKPMNVDSVMAITQAFPELPVQITHCPSFKSIAGIIVIFYLNFPLK